MLRVLLYPRDGSPRNPLLLPRNGAKSEHIRRAMAHLACDAAHQQGAQVLLAVADSEAQREVFRAIMGALENLDTFVRAQPAHGLVLFQSAPYGCIRVAVPGTDLAGLTYDLVADL